MTETFRIYMDDSGNVDPKTTNAPELRFGSISAVILPSIYLDTKFNVDFQAMTMKHFGPDEEGRPHAIHRRILGNPPPDGPFSVLRDEAVRAAWNADVLSMFRRAQYTVITACIDKVQWYHRYPEWRGCFYEILVQCVLERCFYFLRYEGRAEVNIEWKDVKRNDRIKAAYRDALLQGFPPNLTAQQLRRVFTSLELNILTKKDRRPGCQLGPMSLPSVIPAPPKRKKPGR